jgi:hypothetical protein
MNALSTTRWLALTIGGLLMSFSGESRATTFKQVHSGLTSVTPIYKTIVGVNANETVRLETFDLSTGADTVLHVQNSSVAHEPFVAGNDDCAPPQRHSCVTLSVSPSPRSFSIYIRGYAGTSGNARLRVIRNGVTSLETSTFSFGGKQIPATFNAGSRVATTLIQKELSDSVVLLISSTAVAIAADDDDGAGLASNVRSPSTFSGHIVLGAYNYGSQGANAAVTLIQDDSVETNDPDGDGLSSTLETLLAISPAAPDSDGDGISDGREVLGEANGQFPELELPTWGAHPQVKDLFVEVDWNECPVSNPGCGGNINFYRFTSAEVSPVVQAFWGPTSGTLQPASDSRVAVHMDIGVANPDPAGSASLTQWGNWFGAGRVQGGAPDCSTLNAGRTNIFHLAQVTGYGSAGEGHWCARVPRDGKVTAHELGHNMFIGSHGGMRGAGASSYKAVWPSIMNYSYQWHPGVNYFSLASFRGVNFNPTSVSESDWKANAPHADPSLLTNLGFNVSGNVVDWNHDGVLGGTVKAAVNWQGTSGSFRDLGYHEGGFGSGIRDPAMTWYRTLMGNRFYMFYVTGFATYPWQVKYRYSTDLQSSCGANITDPALIDLPTSPCASWTSEQTVPGVIAKSGIAVVEFFQNGVWKLMLIYVDENSRLMYTILAAGEFSYWSTPAVVDPNYDGAGGVSAAYDPVSGTVELFGRDYVGPPNTDPQVVRWSFNPTASTWTAGALQQYGNGNPVLTKEDVSVTLGYLKGNTAPTFFMAIPRGDNEWVTVARRTAQNTWEATTATGARSNVRPGIAYVPFNTTDITTGRLMIVGRDRWAGKWGNAPTVSFSEGNDIAASAVNQRLSTWKTGYYYIEEDQADIFGMALYHNTQLDTNVRGAFTIYGSIWFQPIADGIVPFSHGFRDQNDYDMMKRNLKCSLDGDNGSSCRRCFGLNADGTCASWEP